MNLKKITFITSILISSTLIIGCTSKIEKEAIEQGKTALVDGNYEEANKVFQFALEENPKNEDAKHLKNLSTLYLKANECFKEKNYIESENIIKELESNENSKLISDDLEILKKKINDTKSQEEKINDTINKLEVLIKEKKFNEAKVILDEFKNKKLPQEYVEKLKNLSNEINNSINTNTKKEENKKLSTNEAMELLNKNTKLNQDQYYKFSSKDYYILDNGSEAYVINKYYKPKVSNKEQLIAQYYIDVLTGKITEKIAGVTKEIN